MKTVDFYSGEPSVDGSPPLTENEAMLAAAEQASEIRKYSYDPVARQAIQFNGGYYTQPQSYYPMRGIGYPPYQPYPGYYSPYQPYQQYYQQPQPPQVPTKQEITIPGLNRGGSEFLFSQEMLNRLEEMKIEYVNRRREIEVSSENINYGTNYYGVPFSNTNAYWKIRELDQEFMEEIEKIKEEARENRKRFNLSIGKISHSALNEKISDETLHQRYYGKSVSYEAPVVQNLQEAYSEAYRFYNLVEVNTAAYYQNIFTQIRNMHAQYYIDDGDPKHAFKNYGLLSAKYDEEKQMHELRNFSKDYDSTTYSRLMKQKIRERKFNNDGTIQAVSNNQFIGYPTNPNMAQFPTLAQNARLADDGTLHITCNFGSHTGEVLSVHNSQEQEYEKDRERFNRFLASIPDANMYRGDG